MKSIAAVITPRAARYGKQLASHMGRKISTAWEDETGRLEFLDSSTVALRASAEELTMTSVRQRTLRTSRPSSVDTLRASEPKIL